MINVVVLGAGNVGQHLINAFIKADEVSLVQVYNRTLSHIAQFKQDTIITDDLSALAKADVYIIAVPDQAVHKVSEAMPRVNGVVAHTSGTTPMSVLSKHNRRGIFYPLQTFSKAITPDFASVPFLLESQAASDLLVLQDLAGTLSDKIYDINSEQRRQIHLSAVMVNNFVNHINYLAFNQLEKKGLPTDLLKPLMEETLHKLTYMSPYEAQTGPAKRGDEVTIRQHLALLDHDTNKQVYNILTKSIREHYGKKL